MEEKTGESLSVLSWNVSSLIGRFIDVLQFVLENDIDVVALQETRIDNTFCAKFSNYQKFLLPASNTCRGLLIYVKQSIAAARILPFNFGGLT